MRKGTVIEPQLHGGDMKETSVQALKTYPDSWFRETCELAKERLPQESNYQF